MRSFITPPPRDRLGRRFNYPSLRYFLDPTRSNRLWSDEILETSPSDGGVPSPKTATNPIGAVPISYQRDSGKLVGPAGPHVVRQPNGSSHGNGEKN